MAEEQTQSVETESASEIIEEIKETKAPAKKESEPAVKKEKKKEKSSEKIELDRVYVIPLKKEFQKVPRYKKAKKAVKAIKQFLAKHMKVEERDLKKIKVDIYLNNEIWFRGIRKPVSKIKVRAIKKGGIVYAELAEIPEAVQFKMNKDKKKKENAPKAKEKPKEEELPLDKEVKEEIAFDKKDEMEKEKSVVEEGLKLQKEAAKEMKHESKPMVGKQEATKIHRKAMKR